MMHQWTPQLCSRTGSVVPSRLGPYVQQSNQDLGERKASSLLVVHMCLCDGANRLFNHRCGSSCRMVQSYMLAGSNSNNRKRRIMRASKNRDGL